jgi:hypothetical protein
LHLKFVIEINFSSIFFAAYWTSSIVQENSVAVTKQKQEHVTKSARPLIVSLLSPTMVATNVNGSIGQENSTAVTKIVEEQATASANSLAVSFLSPTMGEGSIGQEIKNNRCLKSPNKIVFFSYFIRSLWDRLQRPR